MRFSSVAMFLPFLFQEGNDEFFLQIFHLSVADVVVICKTASHMEVAQSFREFDVSTATVGFGARLLVYNARMLRDKDDLCHVRHECQKYVHLPRELRKEQR
ncbi:hypothetical protein NE237_023599 [Protea cynaroides]|uniref:Uncharacterized protein n=1 Tax=Protea cynaroides TaxID=273540 RepID=A0A9Q0HD81_9MAGN|nr:hypothetical protein NE237_023599 [Protea cynaroides]